MVNPCDCIYPVELFGLDTSVVTENDIKRVAAVPINFRKRWH